MGRPDPPDLPNWLLLNIRSIVSLNGHHMIAPKGKLLEDSAHKSQLILGLIKFASGINLLDQSYINKLLQRGADRLIDGSFKHWDIKNIDILIQIFNQSLLIIKIKQPEPSIDIRVDLITANNLLIALTNRSKDCLLYTSPSPRD